MFLVYGLGSYSCRLVVARTRHAQSTTTLVADPLVFIDITLHFGGIYIYIYIYMRKFIFRGGIIIGLMNSATKLSYVNSTYVSYGNQVTKPADPQH